jgi:hypothetical protein
VIYVAIAVVVVVVLVMLGQHVLGWRRNGPLRREMRAQPVTFRTDLRWVKVSDPPGWMYGAGYGIRNVELIVRGDMFQVGNVFSAIMGVEYYFRAWETTIEVSRNPLGIYGIDGKREWIVVSGQRDSRDFRLAMTKKYFLDDVWNALVRAGAVPRSDGPHGRHTFLG